MRPLTLSSKLFLVTVIVVSVVIPFQFWHGVWFGRPLTDGELDQYLNSDREPRHIQHALAQIEERIRHGDAGVQRWYGQITRLGTHSREDIRLEAAWVMGQDNQSRQFHQALLQMLEDEHPLVRRNAALSLVRFGEERAVPTLRAMLEPSVIRAQVAGRISFSVRAGEWVSRGEEVARIFVTEHTSQRVTAGLSGSVQSLSKTAGATVARGDVTLVLAPDPEHVWEALRALYIVGDESELDLVEPFQKDPRYEEKVRAQARLTAQAIRQKRRGG
ncbi:MAG: HEAT repeat domain-containing protein [Acidobacteriota bacterium]